MSRTRPALAVVAALLCAVLLAGCGGTSKADYEKDVKAIGDGVEKDLDSLDSDNPSADDIDKAKNEIEEAADKIDDIDPPSEVKGLHEDLVSVLHDTSDLMGEIAPLIETATKDPSKLSSGDIKKLEKVSTDFQGIEGRMEKIEKGYDKKDYDIGLGEESSK